MADRSRIRVVVDGVEYPDAKDILIKLGVTSSAERSTIRDKLRRVGRAEVVFRGRTHVIEAIP